MTISHTLAETLSTTVDHPAPALSDAARTFAQASSAATTRHAYRADWHDFTAWCADHRVAPLPAAPVTVADELADRATDHPDRPARRDP